MDVETDVLRWFQHVADGVTVTEVAEQFWVSQPAVSRGLGRLETEVGVPLLRRSGRALRMTQAGAVFKRHVDALLNDLDDGLAAVQQLIDPATGVVAVAFQPSLGSWLVPRLIGSFQVDHPNVRFVLGQARDEFVPDMLDTGAVDVGITTVRTADPGVHWQFLMSEPLYLAVPGTHRLAERSDVALGDLAAEPFVMLRRPSPLRDQIEELCRRAGFEPRLAFEAEDLPTVRGFVASGLGVAVLPATQDGPAPLAQAVIRLLPITDPPASREIGLAWSAERRLLPSAEAFRQHVVDQARAHHLPPMPRPSR
jgi:LysR family transcriptional regulator, transcription activator of glutamate synthase operon